MGAPYGGEGGSGGRESASLAPESLAEQSMLGLGPGDLRVPKAFGDSTTRTCGTCLASKVHAADFASPGNP